MGRAKVARRQAGSSDKKHPSRGQIKKKEARNSIGRVKQKRGAAARYMIRTKALRTLQLPLKDFRRLCILKGIYPRDPPKKFKGADKTYYYTKDILYLQHEPLLDKFRELSAVLKKVVRRVGRGQTDDAARLYNERPQYRLDHLIRERYPTFPDALRDLDDALCLLHLFASVPADKQVPAARVGNCARLVREFQAYVAHAHCLRKVFASIKGFYFEAEVFGIRLLWLAPHQHRQDMPADVDVRVLLTFLEFYETLLHFVNFKLFAMVRMRYPPPAPAEASSADTELKGGVRGSKRAHRAVVLQGAGANDRSNGDENTLAVGHIGIAEPGLQSLLVPVLGSGPASLAGGTVHAANLRRSNSPYEAPNQEAMARFRRKLSALDEAKVAAAERAEAAQADAAAEEEAGMEAIEAALGVAGEGDEGEGGAQVAPLLFEGLRFLLGRETPVATLEFVLLAFGATVTWDGDPGAGDTSPGDITHEVVDRPTLRGSPVPGRVYVQPQWVLDSVNEKQLLPTHAYAPGCKPPPHLSPFADGGEGYEPPERSSHPAFGPAVRAQQDAARKAEESAGVHIGHRPADAEDEEDEEDAETGADEQQEQRGQQGQLQNDDEEEGEEEEEEGEEEEGVADGDVAGPEDVDRDHGEEGFADEARFRAELAAERRGGMVDMELLREKAAREIAQAARAGAIPGDSPATHAERKELAKMLMRKKDRRLYDRMQFGLKRKQAAADKLVAKRERLASADLARADEQHVLLHGETRRRKGAQGSTPGGGERAPRPAKSAKRVVVAADDPTAGRKRRAVDHGEEDSAAGPAPAAVAKPKANAKELKSRKKNVVSAQAPDSTTMARKTKKKVKVV